MRDLQQGVRARVFARVNATTPRHHDTTRCELGIACMRKLACVALLVTVLAVIQLLASNGMAVCFD
jgi:hypothetical protein